MPKHRFFLSLVCLLLLGPLGSAPLAAQLPHACSVVAPEAGPHRPVSRTEARQAPGTVNLAALPMSFEMNQGQADARVEALARGSGYALFLTREEAVLRFQQAPQGDRPASLPPVPAPSKPGASRTATLRMRLVGADTAAPWTPEAPQAGHSNYFLGRDPSAWRTAVARYSRIRQRDVYPGTDLVYYGKGGALEYDFVLAPGADPHRIALDFKGAKGLDLRADGSLVLRTALGEVVQKQPEVYQVVEGRRVAVAGAYRRMGARRVGFEVGPYDPCRELVIDPVLVFSTYLGGSSEDRGVRIATDTDGNILVAGFTFSNNFPLSSALQGANAGPYDAFVAKLNPAGSALLYSTYLGGSGSDFAYGLAVDSGGNALVAGYTVSTNFPLSNALQGANAGGYDAFVAKLNPAGNALLYSTYLGGSSDDTAYNIATDAAGNALLAGYTYSTNFPVSGALQGANAGGYDAFVAKLDPAGSALVYATYLGGSSYDLGLGIAVDTAGNALVTGYTESTNFPLSNAYQGANAGASDAFVAKLNPAGSALVYSTYLGGNGFDYGHGIAADSAGGALVAGYTNATNFPMANALNGTNAGNFDAFVTKLNPAGSALVYSTYLGGSSNDYALCIATDSDGNALVTGYTYSTNFPLSNALQGTNGGISDAFVSKLNSSGSALSYSTYLGGGHYDEPPGIAADRSGNAIIAGSTYSTNLPLSNALQGTKAGDWDAFVAKISSYAYPASVSALSGTPQSATISTAFAAPLVARVLDAALAPVPGVRVRFTAPGAGASGTFAGGLPTAEAVTDASGDATSPVFTANATTGSYAVAAAIVDTAVTASFSLTNTPAAPVITSQPVDLTVNAGNPAAFTVVATGTAPITYQWYRTGFGPLAGATSATHGIPVAYPWLTGQSFYCVVTDAVGTTTSTTATLTVIPATFVISSFSPASGLPGAVVTIIGSNFAGASVVRFNGTPAAFTLVSATQIRATVPAGATSGRLSVTAAGGTAFTTAGFTVLAATPRISSFSPSAGTTGTVVTINGTNLGGATQVTFNGAPATFTQVSATQIKATVPAAATTGPLAVTTPLGTGTTGTVKFTKL